MTSIAVLGATGNLGQHVARQVLARGCSLSVAVRSRSRLAPEVSERAQVTDIDLSSAKLEELAAFAEDKMHLSVAPASSPKEKALSPSSTSWSLRSKLFNATADPSPGFSLALRSCPLTQAADLAWTCPKSVIRLAAPGQLRAPAALYSRLATSLSGPDG